MSQQLSFNESTNKFPGILNSPVQVKLTHSDLEACRKMRRNAKAINILQKQIMKVKMETFLATKLSNEKLVLLA